MIGGGSVDSQSVILEKLSFQRLFKANIDVIWKALRTKYIGRFPGVFKTEAYTVCIDEGLDDIGGVCTGRCVKPTYNFNKARALFVKEPFIIFCLNRDYFYFDPKDITESLIRDSFLESYKTVGAYKTMREIKDDKRYILWEYLRDVKGYDPDRIKRVRLEDCDLSGTSYGDALVKKACQEVKKVTKNAKPDYTCKISFIDDKLLPMLIYDTEYNNVYNAYFDRGDFSLNRKTLKSYYCIDEFSLYEFLDGYFDEGVLQFTDFYSPSGFRIG